MTDFIVSFGITPVQWLLLMAAAALIGANKTGLVSISLISIPIMALIFGGKASTGVMLPVLVVADIFAVLSYRNDIRWRELFSLMPWSLGGVVVALYVGNTVPDSVFKIIIAISIIVVLFFMTVREFSGRDLEAENHWYLNALIGLVGGFSTMIGNAAGPIIAVYFLSLKLSKNEFIATRAWFFWLLNLIKLPFHFFVWQTIGLKTLGLDLLMVPGVVIGAFIGVRLVKKIPERPYRIFVIAATFAASVFLII